MNKKLIAAAIAAAVAAPVASAADTTLYGKAHVSIQSNDNGANDNYTVNSNASRIGIKGSEDLGDGLKAIFKYEMGYDISDGGSKGPISARNAYVGLSGSWGTFLAGRHDTPAKVAFYASGTDFLDDSVIDINAVAGLSSISESNFSTFTEVRADNAIAYISPNMSGFTVAAAVVPGENHANHKTANNLADAYSLAVIYSGGGLKASVGYEVVAWELLENGRWLANDHVDQKMWQVGASYTLGDFTIAGNYEKDSDYFTTKGMDRTAWAVAGKANFGNNYVVLNYGNNDRDRSESTSDASGLDGIMENADGYGIAVGHKFSKRTQVYAAYHVTDYTGKITKTVTAAGGSKTKVNESIEDTASFALGIIHTF